MDESTMTRISDNYGCMNAEHDLEIVYADYAKKHFLLSDDLCPTHKLKIRRHWVTNRIVELLLNTDDKFWKAPPLLDPLSDAKLYTFNLKPDGAYWISLQGYNPKHKRRVADYVYVSKARRTSPYLFIEFKRDDKDLSCAENAVAAVSAVALYNRFLLRKRRQQIISHSKARVEGVQDLKIYGLTFTAAIYTV